MVVKWLSFLALAVMGTNSMALADDAGIAARNTDILMRWHASMKRRDLDAALKFYSEDARNFGRPVSAEGYLRVWNDILTTFPDWKMELLDTVAAGDSVVMRFKVSATHAGIGRLPINGGLLVGVAPTHRHFEVQHIHWFKLRDGKIVDHYATRDDIGMMQQLGLLPEVGRPDVKPPG
jgi:predicted ester cyclase